MILSCPSCSTRYSVAEDALGAGRTVRCASCGHSWRAEAPVSESQPAFLSPDPEPEEQLRPARRNASQAYRAKVEAKKRRRRLTIAAAGWGGAFACLALALGLAFMFRLDVVRALPRTASAYALAGVEANIYGIGIENLVSEKVLEDGDLALSVRAELRNIDRRERYTPLVRFDLRDATGEPFFAWTVTPEKPVLEPGETAMVAAVLIDPPERASDVIMTLTDTPIAPGSATAPISDPSDHEVIDPAFGDHGADDAHGEEPRREDGHYSDEEFSDAEHIGEEPASAPAHSGQQLRALAENH